MCWITSKHWKRPQEVARQLYEMVSPGKSRVLITSRERLVDEPFVYDYLSEAYPNVRHWN
ncbi:hypothetical protein HC928_20225 [bacterium]|nr:hypothetical protein [bacterium]